MFSENKALSAWSRSAPQTWLGKSTANKPLTCLSWEKMMPSDFKEYFFQLNDTAEQYHPFKRFY